MSDCSGDDIIDELTKVSEVATLDRKIVDVCNNLVDVRNRIPKDQVMHVTEMARLQRVYESKCQEVEARCKEYESLHDLSDYRKAVKEVHQKDFSFIPSFASSREAQLCHRLHMMTMGENQFALVSQQVRDLTRFLDGILRQQQEEMAAMEVRMLSSICELEREIRDYRTQLDGTPIYKDAEFPPRLGSTKKQKQQQPQESAGKDRVQSSGSTDKTVDSCFSETDSENSGRYNSITSPSTKATFDDPVASKDTAAADSKNELGSEAKENPMAISLVSNCPTNMAA